MNSHWLNLAQNLTPHMHEVCAQVLELLRQPLTVQRKADWSAVTNVDLFVDDQLYRMCTQLEPGVPYVSEESGDLDADQSDYWLVDPIDGTQSLVQGSQEFCVCVSRMHAGRPVMGMIAVPHTAQVFWGCPTTQQAYCVTPQGTQTVIQVNTHTRCPPHVVHSRQEHVPHVQQILGKPFRSIPQHSAIKFVRVAQGHADHYVRTFGMCAWDCAAGDALVTAAGGTCSRLTGKKITYVSPDQYIPDLLVSGARA